MADQITQHISLLGHRVEDKVTGLRGVVTSISFDLYGCVQGAVHPGLDGEGKVKDSFWIDICRLSVLDEKPVMPCPDFGDTDRFRRGEKGPAEKPAMKF